MTINTESQEMYLKAIYMIGRRKPIIRKIDIAEELGISKPSVTTAINRLIRVGEVTTNEHNHVLLTEAGQVHAAKVVKRYEAFVSMLCYMDIPEEKAKEVACKLEHVIDDDVFDYIIGWVKKKKKEQIGKESNEK